VPTYEYECQECGGTHEFFQKMSESPKRKCPDCGRLRLKKLISSGGGLIFKGSGFYITDYRSDDYKKAASAESSAASSSGSKSKSDSKKGDSSSSSSSSKSDSKSKSSSTAKSAAS